MFVCAKSTLVKLKLHLYSRKSKKAKVVGCSQVKETRKKKIIIIRSSDPNAKVLKIISLFINNMTQHNKLHFQ